MKSIKKNVDELAELLRLPAFSKVEELNSEYTWDAGNQAYEATKKDGGSDKEALEEREHAEIASSEDLYRNWRNSVLAAVDLLFEHVHLMVVPLGKKEKTAYTFEVSPVRGKSWEAAAGAIRDIVHGVGLAQVAPGDLKPAQTFVSKHLHWIKMYSEVYGTSSADRVYNANWRD